MLVGIRYEKGYGSNLIFARARNQFNQFYNFTTTEWVPSENVDTMTFLTEYADNDPIDSLYSGNIMFPLVESYQEIVDSTLSIVIGAGIYSPITASGGALTLAEIETSAVLMKSNDPRLDNLDVPLSSVATYEQIDNILAPLLDEIDSIKGDINNVADALMGSWEIVGTQMIFYKREGSELMRFDLTNKFGGPSDHSVFKRTKV